MQRYYVAVAAMTGAIALGAMLAATTPTNMLEKNDADWRRAVPTFIAAPTYIAVGSAPESVEFGRRPLDSALLAQARFDGETLIIDEAANVEVVGMIKPDQATPETDPLPRPVAEPHLAPEGRHDAPIDDRDGVAHQVAGTEAGATGILAEPASEGPADAGPTAAL